MDIAAQPFDNPLADGQSQAGAAKPTRHGAIALGKRIEQAMLSFAGNSDPCVDHADVQFFGLLIEASDNIHAADLGELDRIPHEIGQHLASYARSGANHRCLNDSFIVGNILKPSDVPPNGILVLRRIENEMLNAGRRVRIDCRHVDFARI